MRKEILAVSIFLIVIVALVVVNPLKVVEGDGDGTFKGASSTFNVIPEIYNVPQKVDIQFGVYNDVSISGDYGLYSRIIDKDANTETAWVWQYGIIGNNDRYETMTYHSLSFFLPGANGLKNDFHGRLEVGYINGGDIENDIDRMQLSCTMDFTVEYGVPNTPPITGDAPIGPESAETGETISYIASGSDADGDEIKFFFDWGDGTTSGWGRHITSHSWNQEGTYYIKYKVRDTNLETSQWSPTKRVIVEENDNGGGGGGDNNEETVSVLVKDIYSRPIEGAKVILSKKSEGDGGEKITDNSGTASFIITTGIDNWDIYVQKNGYIDVNKQGISFSSNNCLEIAIMPKDNGGNNGTPGFDLLVFISAIVIAFVLIRRKRA